MAYRVSLERGEREKDFSFFLFLMSKKRGKTRARARVTREKQARAKSRSFKGTRRGLGVGLALSFSANRAEMTGSSSRSWAQTKPTKGHRPIKIHRVCHESIPCASNVTVKLPQENTRLLFPSFVFLSFEREREREKAISFPPPRKSRVLATHAALCELCRTRRASRAGSPRPATRRPRSAECPRWRWSPS